MGNQVNNLRYLLCRSIANATSVNVVSILASFTFLTSSSKNWCLFSASTRLPGQNIFQNIFAVMKCLSTFIPLLHARHSNVILECSSIISLGRRSFPFITLHSSHFFQKTRTARQCLFCISLVQQICTKS